MPRSHASGELRIRIMHGARVAMGPGKADLLEGIRDSGSISAAGRRMKMSYKRAWQLVDEMNACFAEPVVEASTGGSGGGGAQLTATGTAVLARFRALQRRCERAAHADIAALCAALRPDG
ncbi:winged helix-turn-helix domain-containing protein [Dokdonella sp. MW10]|uniref:winged helix-turn-helix domain-containing protein n=1 Tax=Dokdonella sp. MW10 TaxID=2992926 RepID=UPI003F817053